ncbi:MAG: PIN domain-containing protein [Caldilineaceae bacterium]|nr:PIN domain-containing protein [Caldilineaceae bacterium]
MPASRALWEDAAEIRADLNLRIPDALPAAIGIQERWTLFATNDGEFRRVAGFAGCCNGGTQGLAALQHFT